MSCSTPIYANKKVQGVLKITRMQYFCGFLPKVFGKKTGLGACPVPDTEVKPDNDTTTGTEFPVN